MIDALCAAAIAIAIYLSWHDLSDWKRIFLAVSLVGLAVLYAITRREERC